MFHSYSLVFICIAAQCSCSIRFHSSSLVFTPVHSCSLVFYSCSLVFTCVHSRSLVFTSVHSCSDSCGVLAQIILLICGFRSDQNTVCMCVCMCVCIWCVQVCNCAYVRYKCACASVQLCTSKTAYKCYAEMI